MTAEKLLPQSIEAELSTLGSLIIDPEAISQVIDLLRAEDFYRDAHRVIFQAIVSLYEQQTPADFITLCEALERQNQLEEVGGASQITSLVNMVPTSGNLLYYAQLVKKKATFRRLIHAAGVIAAMAYGEEEDALDRAEQTIFALSMHQGTSDFTPIAEVMRECMQQLDAIHERDEAIIGVPSGFHHLDVALSGFNPSDLIILAARPGTGKTSLMLNFASNAAYQARKHVAIFSLEMSTQQLGLRLISMQSQIDQMRLRKGLVHDEEWEKIISTMGDLSDGAVWIEETAGISLTSLRSKARRLHATVGLDLILVDYLQLMRVEVDGKRPQLREQEIAEISRGLKGLAKELNVPVIALAQLSRALESRQSKVPQLSDLRESGAIENDSDVVLFIYREELYIAETEARGCADIIIAKHRNGPVGTIRLGFEASQTRFYEMEEQDVDEEGLQ